MKLFLASVLLVAVAADRLENTYLPPGNAPTAGGNGNFLAAPSAQYLPASSGAFAARQSNFGAPGFGQAKTNSFAPSGQYRDQGAANIPSGQYGAPTKYAAKSAEAGAAILRFSNENLGDGSYRFEYETENKISQQEAGELKQDGSEEGNQSVHGSYSYLGDDGKTYTVNYVADENGFRPVGDHIAEAIQTLAKNAAETGAQGYDRNAQTAYRGNPQAQQFNSAPSKPSLDQQSGYQY